MTTDQRPSLPDRTPTWVEDFGVADYETVWQRQKRLVEKRINGEITDGVLIGEHEPVITLGRGSHAENLFNPTVPTLPVERGGDVTYHGPGQIVAYPITLLPENRRDLHRYLRELEQSVIETLRRFGVEGVRNPGLTGVWIQTQANGETTLKKVCAIGVAVKRWVTYHGLSLNVNCDLSAYRQLNPCGLESGIMANMQDYAEQALDIGTVKQTLLAVLKDVAALRQLREP